MIQIRLTSNDIRWATQVGQVRWRRAVNKGSKARFAGAKEAHHLMGAAGELAFCRALSLPWPASIDSYSDEGKPDVYPNWEVRTAPRMRGVKVVPTDPDSRLVVWVVGDVPAKDPVYTVMGYIRAGGAKRHAEWFEDPGGRDRAFWKVPEARMIPINPGFHSSCGYAPDERGIWGCIHCGAGIERVS